MYRGRPQYQSHQNQNQEFGYAGNDRRGGYEYDGGSWGGGRGGGDENAGYHEQSDSHHRTTAAPIRYSALSPEEKAQVRAQERAVKKERDRKIRYFLSLQQSLLKLTGANSGAEGNDLEGPSGATEQRGPEQVEADREIITSMLNGLYTELSKMLKDPEERKTILIGTVCKSLETAISLSSLAHLETLLYLMLGFYNEVILSRTGSYLIETIFAAVLLVLARSDLGGRAAAGEDGDGQPQGTNAASTTVDGMPNIWELVMLVTDELCDNIEGLNQIVTDRSGSRALSSMMKVMAGLPVREVTLRPEDKPVRFNRALTKLVASVAKCVELNGGWKACATAQITCVVVQAVVECAGCSKRVATVIKAPIQSLLSFIVTDPIGIYTVERFLTVTCSWVAPDAPDEDKRWWYAAYRSIRTKLQDFPSVLVLPEGVPQNKPDDNSGNQTTASSGRSQPSITATRCIDPVAMSHLLSQLISSSPSEQNFEELCKEILFPHLALILSQPALFPIALRAAQKCTALSRAAERQEAERSGMTYRSKEMIQVAVPVSGDLKKQLVHAVLQGAKAHSSKGLAHYLLITCHPANLPQATEYHGTGHHHRQGQQNYSEGGYGGEAGGDDPEQQQQATKVVTNVGPELLTELLKFGNAYASAVAHNFDKLSSEDLMLTAEDPQGTHVLQQLVVNLAEEEGVLYHKAELELKQSKFNNKGGAPSGSGQPATAKDKDKAGAGAEKAGAKRGREGDDAGDAESAAASKLPPGIRPGAEQRLHYKALRLARVGNIADAAANPGGIAAALIPGTKPASAQKAGAHVRPGTHGFTGAGKNQGKGGVAEPSAADAGNSKIPQLPPAAGPLTHFFRRLENQLVRLACHRYASFVIQQIYDQGTLALRERMAQSLSKHMNELKDDFFAGKLMAKCMVEQYMYRKEEWFQMAERQSTVKRLMQQILATHGE
jgi:hypothetical protein